MNVLFTFVAIIFVCFYHYPLRLDLFKLGHYLFKEKEDVLC